MAANSSFHGGLRKLAWPIIVCCLVCLDACMVVSGSYYRPSADVGSVYSEGGGGCGPQTRLKIQRNGVVLWLDTDSSNSGGNLPHGIGITFYIPKDRDVVFDSSSVIAYDAGKHILSSPPNLYIDNRLASKLQLRKEPVVLSGKTHILKGTSHSRYLLFIRLNEKLPLVFSLQLPAMKIGGKYFPETFVRFTKTQGHWIVGGAC